MSDDGFYVQFPSNASMDIFKDNTLSSYTNNFKQPLVLKGEHLVGVAEVQYPQSWNNVRVKNNTFEIIYLSIKNTGLGEVLDREIFERSL